jgi:hypothetical protein
MPVYHVAITATITKNYTIRAPDEDKAAEVAHQIFSVLPEEPEDYNQDTHTVEEVTTYGEIDGEYDEEFA